MGQLKKILELMDSCERLPDDSFKEEFKTNIEQMKELYAEIHTLEKMRDRLEEKDDTHKNG